MVFQADAAQIADGNQLLAQEDEACAQRAQHAQQRQRPGPKQPGCRQRRRRGRRHRGHCARHTGQRAQKERLPRVEHHQCHEQHRVNGQHDEHRALQHHVAGQPLRGVAEEVVQHHQADGACAQQRARQIGLADAAADGPVIALHRCGQPQHAQRRRRDGHAARPRRRHAQHGKHHQKQRAAEADDPPPRIQPRDQRHLLLQKARQPGQAVVDLLTALAQGQIHLFLVLDP